MKKIVKVLMVILSTAGFIFSTSCTKDELNVVRDIPPSVYLTQVKNGNILIKPENSSIDKVSKEIYIAIGVSRSGINNDEAFSVELKTSHTELPDGVVALPSNVIGVNKIEVEPGKTSGFVYLKIPKSILDENTDKTLGITISIVNPSKYKLNESLTKANVLLSVSDFAEKLIDVTSVYLKNIGGGNGTFERSDNLGTRFGVLKDWTTNDSAKNQEGGKAGGFDSYNGNGSMSLEQWYSPVIANGKIYQTVNLPAGKYSFELVFEGKQIKDQAFIVAALGNEIPNTESVSSALAKASFDASKVTFSSPEQQDISIGVVVNFIQNEQYFRVREVKLFKFKSVFD